MAMSFGLTTASAIFFFRGKFGNVITKLCHVVGPFVRNWTLLTKHDNEANATRQSGGKMIYSKIFINKNPYRGGNKSRKLKSYVATTDTLCFQHHVSSHSPRKVTFTRCNPMLTVNWSIIFSNHCSSCLQAQFPNLLQHRLRILQAQMSAKLRITDIS